MRRSFFIIILGGCLAMGAGFLWAEDKTAAPAADAGQTPTSQASPAAPPAQTPDDTQTQSQPGPLKIMDIEIRGNQIVSTHTIMSKIKSQKGEVLAQETINEDLKRLYATNFFQDIRMEVEETEGGYKLIILVEEKPIVKKIVIEGYTVFKEDKLRKALKLIEGQILDRRVIKQGEEEIRKMYSDKGFRFVDVQSEINVAPMTKEATVYIRIAEGEKFKIQKMEFSGVKAFKVKKLRRLMKTKERKWYNSGVFKETNFQKDLEKLRIFYQQEGYLDAKVEPKLDYDRKERKIFIMINIEEGQHYVTGELKIKGNEIFPESEIWQELAMLPGLTYSQYYLFKDIEKIRDYYYNHGYMEVRIVPDVRMNRDTGKVDVTYQIQEGDLFFVEKVVVRGNTKTKDIVIRRELRIRPGDRFDGDKIEKSKQRLNNLNYFEEVTYDTEPVSGATNRKNIIFRVKEKRTGELSFGGGVSSVDKFIGFAEIAQHNFDLWNWPRFTGGGQSISLRGRFGSYTKDFSLGFVEPYLFNKPYSLGVDLFDVYRSDQNVDYNQSRLGFGTTLSRLFFDLLRIGGGYTLERVKLYDLSSDAPQEVLDFDGANWLSRMRQFNTYDSRDNIFNPTKGMVLSLSEELVGSFLGGDQDYYSFNGSATKYWTFLKKHLIEARIQLATSQEFGSSPSVPVFDRFYAGGLGTVRGYEYRRVSPIVNGSAVGGQTMAIANLEYSVPIPNLEAFRPAAFIDAGHVNRDSYSIDFGKFAISTGPGIRIKTPIGPVAFYYGFPIANPDEKSKHGRFEFSLSRGF